MLATKVCGGRFFLARLIGNWGMTGVDSGLKCQ